MDSGARGNETSQQAKLQEALDPSSDLVFLADDGHGAERKVVEQMFDPFFTTDRGRGGTGLGLSVAYNIVNGLLGGSIRAESEPGKGMRMILRLPLTAPSREPSTSRG